MTPKSYVLTAAAVVALAMPCLAQTVQAASPTVSALVQFTVDQSFEQRCKFAMISAAINIYNEVGATPGHPARASFATKVLLNTGYDLNTVALAVLSNFQVQADANPAVQGFGITDTDISNAVASFWNVMAGA